MSGNEGALFTKPIAHLAVYAIGIVAIFIGNKIEPTNLAGLGLDFFALLALGLVALFFFGYFLFRILPFAYYSRLFRLAIFIAHVAGVLTVICLGLML